MADLIDVVVVWAPAVGLEEKACLSVAPGTTILQAVIASKLMTPLAAEPRYGVWGKLSSPDTLVRARDRIEIYRPLQADPKLARARRAKKQKERTQKGGVAEQ